MRDPVPRRPLHVSVVGAGTAGTDERALAEAVGAAIARAGASVKAVVERLREMA